MQRHLDQFRLQNQTLYYPCRGNLETLIEHIEEKEKRYENPKFYQDNIYSGVVSTRSLRLSIFLAKLNNMEVWGADIGNAYLEATKEKLYIVSGPEFEELQGHILVIHKALYGLISSGLRWSQRIHGIMLQLRFKPFKADPCVWLREVKNMYEYITIYVDDLLIASEEPQKIIQDLKD